MGIKFQRCSCCLSIGALCYISGGELNLECWRSRQCSWVNRILMPWLPKCVWATLLYKNPLSLGTFNQEDTKLTEKGYVRLFDSLIHSAAHYDGQEDWHNNAHTLSQDPILCGISVWDYIYVFYAVVTWLWFLCLSLCTDSHLKLVQWNFVTHAGIDGYSRFIIYTKCSTNSVLPIIGQTQYTGYF